MMYNKNKKHGENMTHRETAMNNFLKGYNCAQAVLIAYCEELGLDKDTAAMLSCSFGGGMGRLREVCGAVSGMFLVAGFKKGYSDPKDKEAKKKHYELVQLLAKEFKDIHSKVLTYGKSPLADIFIKEVIENPDNTKITFVYKNNEYRVVSPLLGIFNVYNLMASILCLLSFGALSKNCRACLQVRPWQRIPV